jgi:DNA invertase Pin-like site-specific DNA recombinase
MSAIRGASYYRKSNEDDGSSIEQQREWARAACQKEGVELVREFADQAKKGHETASRTAFHEMLAFCQEQARRRTPIEVIVCWHTNRFSRADSIETGHYLHLFRQAGVRRILTAQRWIDFGRGEDRIIFGVNQEASDHKYVLDHAHATARGRVARARAGKWVGGVAPLGYRVEREEVIVKGVRRLRPRRLVLGPEREVEIVRLIFDLYANTPMGLVAVAQELTRRKIPSPRGLPAWTSESVKHILTNPVYLGRLAWNRRTVGKFVGVIDGRPVDRPADNGKARINGKGQWIDSNPDHDKIIDLVTYERCQDKLAARRGGRRRTRGTFVLTGLLRCAHCGRAMVGRTEGNGRQVYFCGGYNHYGKGPCHYNAVAAAPLTDALLAKLREAWVGLNLDAIVRELQRQYDEEAQAGGQKAEVLRRRVRQLDADLAEGIARLRSIDLSLLDGYQKGLKALQAERDQAEADLRREEAAPRPAGETMARVKKAVAKLQALSTAAAASEADLLRELLAEVVTKIEVWFHHEQTPRRVRCKFARALVWVRDDVALLYTDVAKQAEAQDGPSQDCTNLTHSSGEVYGANLTPAAWPRQAASGYAV